MAVTDQPALAGARVRAPLAFRFPSQVLNAFEGGEDGLKRVHYRKPWLAGLLLSPQLLILLFFFFIPSFKALSLAFVQVDPFGGREIFVGLRNFQELFASEAYRNSAWLTFWFTIAQNLLTLAIAGIFAFATDHVIRLRVAYRSILLLPYAIAPVISGAIWAYLFNPIVGPLADILQGLGIDWDPILDSNDAIITVIVASVWKHVCYDYIFLAAAMLAVPQSLREAAAIDGASPLRRLFTITLPLIAPTAMYLFIINMVYGLFDTFAIVDAMTGGGPAGSTTTLVYKVYQDGFVMLNLGSSAAQSIILMVLAVGFTVLQFRAIDRKVNYQV